MKTINNYYKVKLDGRIIYSSSTDTTDQLPTSTVNNHTLENKTLTLYDMKLNLKLNDAGTFEFTIPPNHQWYDYIVSRGFEASIAKHRIVVYQNDEIIFYGRPREYDKDMYGCVVIACEGALAFLNDSIQPRKVYDTTTVKEFFNAILIKHNEQVYATSQVYLGEIDVNPSLSIYRSTDYDTTFDCVSSMLIGAEGGYLWPNYAEKEDGSIKVTIDYFKAYDPDKINKKTGIQTVNFGDNLLSYSENFKLDGLCSRLIPLGKDTDKETYEDLGKDPLTIVEVNDGKNYIVDSNLESQIGIVYGTQTFSDISDPYALLQAGKEYMTRQWAKKLTITVSATDLAGMNINKNAVVQPFRLGQRINVVSKYNGINITLPISELSLNLGDTNDITLGIPEEQTLSEITKPERSNYDTSDYGYSAPSSDGFGDGLIRSDDTGMKRDVVDDTPIPDSLIWRPSPSKIMYSASDRTISFDGGKLFLIYGDGSERDVTDDILEATKTAGPSNYSSRIFLELYDIDKNGKQDDGIIVHDGQELSDAIFTSDEVPPIVHVCARYFVSSKTTTDGTSFRDARYDIYIGSRNAEMPKSKYHYRIEYFNTFAMSGNVPYVQDLGAHAMNLFEPDHRELFTADMTGNFGYRVSFSSTFPIFWTIKKVKQKLVAGRFDYEGRWPIADLPWNTNGEVEQMVLYIANPMKALYDAIKKHETRNGEYGRFDPSMTIPYLMHRAPNFKLNMNIDYYFSIDGHIYESKKKYPVSFHNGEGGIDNLELEVSPERTMIKIQDDYPFAVDSRSSIWGGKTEKGEYWDLKYSGTTENKGYATRDDRSLDDYSKYPLRDWVNDSTFEHHRIVDPDNPEDSGSVNRREMWHDGKYDGTSYQQLPDSYTSAGINYTWANNIGIGFTDGGNYTKTLAHDSACDPGWVTVGLFAPLWGPRGSFLLQQMLGVAINGGTSVRSRADEYDDIEKEYQGYTKNMARHFLNIATDGFAAQDGIKVDPYSKRVFGAAAYGTKATWKNYQYAQADMDAAQYEGNINCEVSPQDGIKFNNNPKFATWEGYVEAIEKMIYDPDNSPFKVFDEEYELINSNGDTIGHACVDDSLDISDDEQLTEDEIIMKKESTNTMVHKYHYDEESKSAISDGYEDNSDGHLKKDYDGHWMSQSDVTMYNMDHEKVQTWSSKEGKWVEEDRSKLTWHDDTQSWYGKEESK